MSTFITSRLAARRVLFVFVVLVLFTFSAQAQFLTERIPSAFAAQPSFAPVAVPSSLAPDKLLPDKLSPPSNPTWFSFGLRLQNANVQALNEALQAPSSPVSQYPALNTAAFGVEYGVRHWFGDALVDGMLGLAFSSGRSPTASSSQPSSSQSSDNGLRSSLVSATIGAEFGYRVWSQDRLSVYPTLGLRGELQSLSFTDRSQTQSNAGSQQLSTTWSSVSTKQTTTRTLSLTSGNIIPVVGVGAEYSFTWTQHKRCACSGEVTSFERDGVVFVHVGYMTGGLLQGAPVATWNNEGQTITDLPSAFSQGVAVRVGFGFNLSSFGTMLQTNQMVTIAE
jgi:hypothetical protein